MADESAGFFKVVVNHEEQHSIWPAHRATPAGWHEAGVSGSREECLEHIRTAWPDITPLSVRTARNA
ncbi:MbtH family protein [Lentzea cavernae]|uniref:Antibiotic synthesis protein MbtH n=1 Tax=Lentzea cavernae TaxID=2020703 RepID=A0ABQ3MH49_9PSEU|nr:MbtH family protein [Lentzea cavernae]GHH43352.1 antibiotic synthesis protein MbtH [Lentzea cavernae]